MTAGGLLEAHPVLAGLFVGAVLVAATLYVTKRLRGGGLVLAALLAASGGATGCKVEEPLAVASLSEATVTLGVGQTIRVFAELNTPADQLGALVNVSVDNGGLVVTEPLAPVPALARAAAVDLTGLAPGTAVLRAWLDAACADPAAGCSAEMTVVVVGLEDPPAAIDSLLPEPAVVAAGDTIRMTVTLRVEPEIDAALVGMSVTGETGAVSLGPDEGGACGAETGAAVEVAVPAGTRAGAFCVRGEVAGTATVTAVLGDSTLSVPITVQ